MSKASVQQTSGRERGREGGRERENYSINKPTNKQLNKVQILCHNSAWKKETVP